MNTQQFKSSRASTKQFYFLVGITVMFVVDMIINTWLYGFTTWSLFIAMLGVSLCIILTFFSQSNTSYELSPTMLIIKMDNEETATYPFSFISSVQLMDNYTGFGEYPENFGLGKNGLTIRLANNHQIYISPKKRTEFLAALQAIHPSVQIETSEQVVFT